MTPIILVFVWKFLDIPTLLCFVAGAYDIRWRFGLIFSIVGAIVSEILMGVAQGWHRGIIPVMIAIGFIACLAGFSIGKLGSKLFGKKQPI